MNFRRLAEDRGSFTLIPRGSSVALYFVWR
jgi:hypothetical protein